MTMMITDRSNIAKISVRGELHKLNKTKNQDAVMVKRYSFGIILCVADGLGSHRYSRFGSRAAVLAVVQTFKAYIKGAIKQSEITKNIASLYSSNISIKHRAEAGTTCIFAAHIYDEGVFIGQIGDGCCYIENGDIFKLHYKENNAFSNIVRPLTAKELSNCEWVTRFINKEKLKEFTIVLATDGISEDILPGQEHKFLCYIKKLVGTNNQTVSRNKLKAFLTDWPSGDDKSLVYYKVT